MCLASSEFRPGPIPTPFRRIFAAIALSGLTLMLGGASADAENRIYLKCEDANNFVVTTDDMDATSIGEELAPLSLNEAIDETYSLVLSYSEAGQSTATHALPGVFEHAGVTIVRPYANSSPWFWKAMTTGEVWPECELVFTRKGPSNSSEICLTITLQTVLVAQIESQAVAQLEASGSGRSDLETITFDFGTITYEAAGP